jgi:hypothetical protein
MPSRQPGASSERRTGKPSGSSWPLKSCEPRLPDGTGEDVRLSLLRTLFGSSLRAEASEPPGGLAAVLAAPVRAGRAVSGMGRGQHKHLTDLRAAARAVLHGHRPVAHEVMGGTRLNSVKESVGELGGMGLGDCWNASQSQLTPAREDSSRHQWASVASEGLGRKL